MGTIDDEPRMTNALPVFSIWHTSIVTRLFVPGNRPSYGWWPLIVLLLLATACSHKAKVQIPKTSRASIPAQPTTPPSSPNIPVAATKPATPTKESRPAPVPETEIPAAVTAKPSLFAVPDSPPIRIGLETSAREVRISSSGEFYLLEKISEATRQLVQGEIQIRIESAAGESAAKYRVQVASFSGPEAAEELRKKLANRFSAPVDVYENQENGRYQVRIGEFMSREQAQEFAEEILSRGGYRDHFIVRENVAGEVDVLTLALRGAHNLFRVNKTGFLFFPASSASQLRLNGKSYRGFLDLTLNKAGRITVVNQLGIEEYLLGVVPAEIDPDYYPDFAALAAQSIAARTYALKNAGRFRSEGFDLTDDIRSQVYAGSSGEKRATNEAVRQTSGLAIYYQNQLIEAMYSSTCGGRTEDYSNVFEGPPVPYLKGVVCGAEAGLERELHINLKGTHELAQPVYSDEGILGNRGLELARVLGIGASEPISLAYLSDPLSRDEALKWLDRARRVTGRTSGEFTSPDSNLSTRAAFLRYAAQSFFGAHEIERRISGADAEYYLANLKDGDAVPRAARKSVAYLMQQNLWRADPENRVRSSELMRRADALLLLARWIESVQPQILRKGVFAGQIGGAAADDPTSSISIKSGGKIQQFPLSRDVHLFLLAKGASTPVDTLKMIGNEKLLFHLADNGDIDFLEVELNPTGTASDRYSPVATWDVTMTRSVLAEKLRSLAGGIGELQDLKPWKLGTSGRAVQIQIVGSRRSVVLNGYKVRNALGLRDTLFTISRALSGDGMVESITFHGRGWGHGVGLCQVGAYGMARAGRSYEEILKTYYQGVEIRRAY